jgi:hypothetical protein
VWICIELCILCLVACRCRTTEIDWIMNKNQYNTPGCSTTDLFYYSGVASYAHFTYANSTIRARQKIYPSMERSFKITRGITDVLKPYQEMFEQLKRQQRQLPITMFFKKTRAAGDSTQSTARAEPGPTTSSTTRVTTFRRRFCRTPSVTNPPAR